MLRMLVKILNHTLKLSFPLTNHNNLPKCNILLDWVLIGKNSNCGGSYKHFVGRHRNVSECAAACRREGPHFVFTRSDSKSIWCKKEECPCFCLKREERKIDPKGKCDIIQDGNTNFHDLYTYRGKEKLLSQRTKSFWCLNLEYHLRILMKYTLYLARILGSRQHYSTSSSRYLAQHLWYLSRRYLTF